MKIELEEWQVRVLRSYFGKNDKTQVAHWAFKVFDDAISEQCHIADVVGRSEQLVCSCWSKLTKTTGGYHCGNAKCSV